MNTNRYHINLSFLYCLAPLATNDVSLLFDNGVVTLDWSQTFQLNGIVSHYDLRRNGILLSRNLATSITLTQEPLEQGKGYLATLLVQVRQNNSDTCRVR